MATVIGQKLVVTGIGAGLRTDGSSYDEFIYEGVRGAAGTQYGNLTRDNFVGGGSRGNEVSLQTNGIRAVMVQRAATNSVSQSQTSVRFYANTVQKSIFTPPLPGGVNISDETLRVIRTAIEENAEPTASLVDDALTLYEDALRGERYREVDQPILLYVTQNPSYVQVNLSFANVGSVVSNAVMLSANPLPNYLAFNLPLSGSSEYSGYTYGWKKKFPQIEIAGDNRAMITQQYEFGLWSNREIFVG